jgi:NAD(P)H-dependent nitrite reductase small subunit
VASWVKVASRRDIPTAGGLSVEAGAKRIAIFEVGGALFAIDDECPHAGAPLSEGIVSGEEVQCSWHGSRFRLRTGEVLEPPAEESVGTYAVRVSGEDVEVEIREAG